MGRDYLRLLVDCKADRHAPLVGNSGAVGMPGVADKARRGGMAAAH